MKKPVLFVPIVLILMITLNTGATERTALVIGNAKYKSKPLRNPANDAKNMAVILKKLGFKVILQIDANKRSMLQPISQFGKGLRDTQVGMFFYAGHGMQVNSGRNFPFTKHHIKNIIEPNLLIKMLLKKSVLDYFQTLRTNRCHGRLHL
mgnify:CR=1 FL=1|jgi:hypothetical protein